MRLNLFFFRNLILLLIFVFFIPVQLIKASESNELSKLWESAIENNKKRNHYAALDKYSKALNISPKNHLLFYNRGLTYANLQLLNQAIKDFNSAIKIRSDFGPAYGDRGMAFYDLNQKDKACADFKKAASLKYKLAVSWINDPKRSSWCIK